MTPRPAPPVLVLEDSDEDFDTVVEAAAKMGLSNPLHRALNGDECLSMLRATGATALRPAVLLLDLSTPGLDGRETLSLIREDAALRALPVVVLSTSANHQDIAHCYASGANAYHVKPLRYDDHLRVLFDVFAYWLASVRLPGGEGGVLR